MMIQRFWVGRQLSHATHFIHYAIQKIIPLWHFVLFVKKPFYSGAIPFFIFFVLFSSSAIFSAPSLLYDTFYQGVGIRPLSLGNAYTAVAEGAVANYYNPAGLAIPGSQYNYQNLDYHHQASSQFYTHHFFLSPFAYTYTQRSDLVGNSVYINSFGFGRKGKRGINWGLTYHAISHRIDSQSSDGNSVDFGMLFYFHPKFTMGLTGHHFFQNNVSVPPSGSLGLSYQPFDSGLSITNDYHLQRQYGQYFIRPAFGIEFFPFDELTLRAGYFQNRFSAGAKIMLPFLQVEYGIITDSSFSGTFTHLLGFNLGRYFKQSKSINHYSIFKKNAFATFSIHGNVTEGKSEFSLLGGQKIGSNDLLHLIKKASEDTSCLGYIIRVSSLKSSLSSIALIQEIRQELNKAKSKGKLIYVYIENWATLPEYYLASVADKIMIPELGTISHLGLHIQLLKSKQFLNQFGISKNTITNGIYKDAWSSSSDRLNVIETQQSETIIRALYQQVLTDIKQSRSIEWDTIYHYFDGRLISAKEAKKLGLVDELGFWADIDQLIFDKQDDPKPIKALALTDYVDIYPKLFLFDYLQRIAVIEIDGSIIQGPSKMGLLFGKKSTGSDDIDLIVNAIIQNPTIKGVLIRINSPGGSLTASDQIYHAIERIKQSGRTVYASMGNIAASGGYYVAMNADKIYVNPGTLTGSIGVISSHQDFSELFDLLNIDYDHISTGQYMDLFSKNRSLSAEDISMLTAFQRQFYLNFVNKLKKNRRLTDAEAFDVAQGQVITGETALQLKLVDQTGNYLDAIDDLATTLDLDPDDTVTYQVNPSRTPPFSKHISVLSQLSNELLTFFSFKSLKALLLQLPQFQSDNLLEAL